MYVFGCLSRATAATNLPVRKANILVDDTGNARLADFGFLTVVSDPANRLSSSSNLQGGTVRWMSPELIAPQQFGLKKSRPTGPSDCYAFGMVIYETISGKLPFHEDIDLTASLKILRGERPRRGTKFTNHLWELLGWCWAFQPYDRPCIEDVLQRLEMVSNLFESSATGSGGELETETDDDGWDSPDGSSDIQSVVGGWSLWAGTMPQRTGVGPTSPTWGQPPSEPCRPDRRPAQPRTPKKRPKRLLSSPPEPGPRPLASSWANTCGCEREGL